MQVTKCENRFEVITSSHLTEAEFHRLVEDFQSWLMEKEAKGFTFAWPTDEDYMAALGPCGK